MNSATNSRMALTKTCCVDADNPIHRCNGRQLIAPIGVKIDITVEDAKVRASFAALAAALLADVVNQ